MDELQGMSAMIVEHWKLMRLVKRVLLNPTLREQSKIASQLRYSENQFASITRKYGLKVVSFDGKSYEPNLPVIVVNEDEFRNNDGLMVDRTLEPAVVGADGVLSMAKVIVREEM